MRLTADVPVELLSPPPLQRGISVKYAAGTAPGDEGGMLFDSGNGAPAIKPQASSKSRPTSSVTSPSRRASKATSAFVDAVWGGEAAFLLSEQPEAEGLSGRPAWGTQRSRPTTSSPGPGSPQRVTTAGSSPGRSKRYGSWYVPPKDWQAVYKDGGPDLRQEAHLFARVGHAGSASQAKRIPTMDDIHVDESMRQRKADLSQALSHQYSVHVYREHLRSRGLPEPQNLTGVKEMSSAAAAQQARKSEAAAAAAASQQQAKAYPRPHPTARPSTRNHSHGANHTRSPRGGGGDDGGGDQQAQRTRSHAQSMSGTKGVPVRNVPVSVSPLMDLDVDEIISPDMRAAVRRTLAMNDLLLTHEQQMQKYAAQRRKQVALLEALAARGLPPHKLLASALAAAGPMSSNGHASASSALAALTPRTMQAMLTPKANAAVLSAMADAGIISPAPQHSTQPSGVEHGADVGHHLPVPPLLQLPPHAQAQEGMPNSSRSVRFGGEPGATADGTGAPAATGQQPQSRTSSPGKRRSLNGAASQGTTTVPPLPVDRTRVPPPLIIPGQLQSHLRSHSPAKRGDMRAGMSPSTDVLPLPGPPPGTALPAGRSLTPTDLAPFIPVSQPGNAAPVPMTANTSTSGLTSPTSRMRLFAVMDARKAVAACDPSSPDVDVRRRRAGGSATLPVRQKADPEVQEVPGGVLAPLAIQVLGLLASQHGIERVAPLPQRSWSPTPGRGMAAHAAATSTGAALVQPLPFSTCASLDVALPVLLPRTRQPQLQPQPLQSGVVEAPGRHADKEAPGLKQGQAQQHEHDKGHHKQRHKHKRHSSDAGAYAAGSPHPAAQPAQQTVFLTQLPQNAGNLSLDWLRGDRVPREGAKKGLPVDVRAAGRKSGDASQSARQAAQGAAQHGLACSSGLPLTPTHIHEGVAMVLKRAGKVQLANMLRHSAPPGVHGPWRAGIDATSSAAGAWAGSSQAGGLAYAMPAAFRPRMVPSPP